MTPPPQAVAQAVLDLLGRRDAGATVCPSEVARALAPAAWRPLMPAVRDAARALALQHRVEVTQRGAVLDPALPWRGPVRLRRGAAWPG